MDPNLQNLLAMDPTELTKLQSMISTIQQAQTQRVGSTSGVVSAAGVAYQDPTQMYINPPQTTVDGTETEHVGVVKSYNASKGYGFISCNATFALYQCDVFLHRNEFERNGLYEGAPVTFGLQWNNQGKPQAVDVHVDPNATAVVVPQPKVVTPRGPGIKRGRPMDSWGVQEMGTVGPPAAKRAAAGAAVAGRFRMGANPGNMWAQAPAMQTMMPTPQYQTPYVKKADPVPESGGPYIGTIKSFNPLKGFGFIECEDTKTKYGRDVFLHKNEFEGKELEVGSSVVFTLQMNHESKPQAVGVTSSN